MMSDCLSAVLVPGPVQTWKFARISGSEISIGVLRSAPLIVILTVFPFATMGAGSLRISKELSKTASAILMLGPPARCLRAVITPLYSDARTGKGLQILTSGQSGRVTR